MIVSAVEPAFAGVLEISWAFSAVGQFGFAVGQSNVTIRGLKIEKFANLYPSGCVESAGGGPYPPMLQPKFGWEVYSPGWIVEDNEVTHCHGVGINNGYIVRGNNVHHNGQKGGQGGVIVEDNDFSYNNYAHFARWWDAGGFKFVAAGGQWWAGTEGADPLIIRRNRVVGNYGKGIWCAWVAASGPSHLIVVSCCLTSCCSNTCAMSSGPIATARV